MKECSIEGCGRPLRAKGLCIFFFNRMRKTGSARPHEPVGAYFDKSEEVKRLNANARNRRWRRTEKGNVYCRAYTRRLVMSGKVNEDHLRKRHGLNPIDKKALYESHGGCCAICGKKLVVGKTHIDHDHHSGIIRGLLCVNCNIGLGNFMDNPENLLRAVEYLEKNNFSFVHKREMVA